MPTGSAEAQGNRSPGVSDKLLEEVAASERLAQVGRLEVLEFCADEAPTLMQEIGRIREREYRAIGAGRGVVADIDQYDRSPQLYRQIAVWDPDKLQLVAMYRYAYTREVLERIGEHGLRTRTLFTFSEPFKKRVLSSAVELGRSVVNSEASAAIRGLHAVWFGLAALVARNPCVRYYFGNVTIPATMPGAATAEIRAMLRAACPPGEGLETGDVAARVKVTPEPHVSRDYDVADHRSALRTLTDSLRRLGVSPPPILLSYLKRSRRLWAFETAFDEDFGGALETAIVIPVAAITDETRKTFFKQIDKEEGDG